MLTELKNERNDDRVKLLCAVMAREFGVTEGLVAAWIRHYQSAMSKGGYPAFRCIRSLVRLMEYCDSHQREPRDMTDSELNDELASLVAGLIETQPERVIEPLTRRSWRVTPPEASETLESGPESRH